MPSGEETKKRDSVITTATTGHDRRGDERGVNRGGVHAGAITHGGCGEARSGARALLCASSTKLEPRLKGIPILPVRGASTVCGR